MAENARPVAPVQNVVIPRECWLRPILVYTLNLAGDWSWSIGFRIGDDIAAKADHIMRFEGTKPVRETIEHFTKRCSAHCWFELSEIKQAYEEMEANARSWHGASKSWDSTIATLRAWGMVA